jgi:hypothetical protein
MAAQGQSSRSMLGAFSAVGFVVLFMVGAIVSNVAATETYPRPEAAAAQVQTYFAENTGIAEFLSLTQAGAAVCLLVLAGVLAAAVRRRDPQGAAEAAVVGLGGGLAAAFLLLSALLVWALSRGQVIGGPAAMTALHQLAFAAGGVGHVAPLGVLVGASSLAALRYGVHARWIAMVGLVSAALSLLSLVTLLILGPAIALIPLGRFTAFFYLMAAGLAVRPGPMELSEPEGSATVASGQGKLMETAARPGGGDRHDSAQ